MGERRDDSYGWSRLAESFVDKLEAFGGRLVGLSPTGLLAVFGAEPMEDVSRRAAHAAIVMAAAAERARRESPEVPPVRLALHSDQVELAETRDGIEIDSDAQRSALEWLDGLSERRRRRGHRGERRRGRACWPVTSSSRACRRRGRTGQWCTRCAGTRRARPAAGHRTAFVGRREELEPSWKAWRARPSWWW